MKNKRHRLRISHCCDKLLYERFAYAYYLKFLVMRGGNRFLSCVIVLVGLGKGFPKSPERISITAGLVLLDVDVFPATPSFLQFDAVEGLPISKDRCEGCRCPILGMHAALDGRRS